MPKIIDLCGNRATVVATLNDGKCLVEIRESTTADMKAGIYLVTQDRFANRSTVVSYKRVAPCAVFVVELIKTLNIPAPKNQKTLVQKAVWYLLSQGLVSK